MAGINKVILIGNLGRDPELRYTQGGSPVCKLNIATTRQWINKQTNERSEETEWHRVVVWGKQAEHCNNYLSKGRTVYVEGRLKTSSYDDKDGQKRYSTEIIAETIQFLGGGAGAGAERGGGAERSGGRNYDRGERSGGPGGAERGGGNANQSGPEDFGDPYTSGSYVPAGPEDDDIPF